MSTLDKILAAANRSFENGNHCIGHLDDADGQDLVAELADAEIRDAVQDAEGDEAVGNALNAIDGVIVHFQRMSDAIKAVEVAA